MPHRLTGALSVLLLAAAAGADPGPPAVVELLLPPGATAAADGRPLDAHTLTVADLRPAETRRVRVAVTFADGSADERSIDVSAGQRILVPVPRPGADRPTTVAAQPLVPVMAAALSRDGRFVAVGTEDNFAVLWDTAAGRPTRTFAGHQKSVTAVAFSPDGDTLLTGSADTTAALWDVRTGRQLRTFRGHARSVLAVAFSPDGQHVLTGSTDATARVWRVSDGRPVHTLKGHSKEVIAVAFSPDGGTIATGSADETAAVWDAATGRRTAVLRGHKENLCCLAFSPDGKRVATGASDNVGIVWDAATGGRLVTTPPHSTDVVSVAFTPDGRRLLTGDREETVQLRDAATGAVLRTMAGHAADVLTVASSIDGRVFLSGSRDGTVRLWDLATGRELLALATDSARTAWAVVAPDGLFDASTAGRRLMGFRFSKRPAGDLDQFFGEYYRPGLLAEVAGGGRPFARRPPGDGKPPLVTVANPKAKPVAGRVELTVDVADRGGGVAGLAVEVNGVRVAADARPGQAGRTTLSVPVAPGPNAVRVTATTADGAYGSAPADVAVTAPRPPDPRGRLYVVAVGVGDRAADATAVADLLRRRGVNVFERVDVVPLLGGDATAAGVEDTVRDVAELTRPQDALVVVVCGRGAVAGDRLAVRAADAGGLAAADLAAAMGAAPALNRALVMDIAGDGGLGFGLRGAVERVSRSAGVLILAATGGESLAAALLAAGPGPADAADWFRAAAERGGPPGGAAFSGPAKGFALLGAAD
jgi:WD40 repeat protein